MFYLIESVPKPKSYLSQTDQRVLRNWKELIKENKSIDDPVIKKHAKKIFNKAALSEDWDSVVFILQNNKDIDLGLNAHGGVQILVKAAECGIYDAITLLLDKGVDINGSNAIKHHTNEHTAVFAAYKNAHWEVLEQLLTYKKQELRSASLEKIFVGAASNRKWKIIDLLVAKGADVNKKISFDLDKISFLEFCARTPEFLPKLQDYLNRYNITITAEGAGQWLGNFCEHSTNRDLVKQLVNKCDKEIKNKYLSHALINFLQNGDEEDIQWCLEQGAKVDRLIIRTLTQQPLEIFQKLVEKLEDTDLRAHDIPIKKIKGDGAQVYMQQLAAVAELKHECKIYAAYLQKIIDNHPTEKNHLSAQEKINNINQLNKTLKFSNVAQSLEQFKKTFNSKEIQDNLATFNDNRGKKFKRVVLAILTGGLYALVRGTQLGSAQFWKSRRNVFVDRANEQLEEKNTPKKI
jgi:hypothetical protein